MSKSRKSRKKSRRPNLSPLSLLRPRLDGLWGSPDWPAKEDAARQGDLTAVTKGVKPIDFLPVMLRAYTATSPAARASLDQTMPAWLEANGHGDDLQTILERHLLDPEETKTAIAWLQAMGVDASSLAEEKSTFYRAFLGEDDLGSQGVYIFFWYANRRRNRVKGLSLLIDYNPPWEGAVKDGILFPQRSPEDAIREFVDMWPDRRVELEDLDPVEAKKTLIELFMTNREAGVRLHRDVAVMRNEIARHILSLPDGPDTPPFTLDDFDELAREGKRAEEIMHFEQTVGRRVRLPDGEEMLVIGADQDDDLFDNVTIQARSQNR